MEVLLPRVRSADHCSGECDRILDVGASRRRSSAIRLSRRQIIDEDILCVHGGLSPEIKTLDQIRNIDRNQEIPYKGAFCDLVWSDPEDVDRWTQSPRGAGWLFGKEVTTHFMAINNLELICRAHQLVHEGIKYMFDRSLVTVWSAPNYCYRCGNVASILSFKSSKERDVIIFKAVPDAERVIPATQTTPYFL